jgi:hypothetical protein
LPNGHPETKCYNMVDEYRRDTQMTGHGVSAPRVAASPLGWSAARRTGWAAAGCAALWLAVLWALS